MKMEQSIKPKLKNINLEIIDEAVKVVDVLDDIQSYIDDLNNQLSIVDSKISDLEHFVENNKLDMRGSCRIIKELHNVTLERRKIKNDMEIARIYNQHLNKLLSNQANRKMFLAELYKTRSRLNKPYNNRMYSQEEMSYLIGKEINNENNKAKNNNEIVLGE